MNKAKIAVLLATYNGARYLREQVASIKAQCNVAVSIFAADDGSTDRTPEILREMRDSDFQLIQTERPAGGACLNFIRLASVVGLEQFDYVAFCDQDDIWFNRKLERAVDCMREMGLDGYSSGVMAFWADGRRRIIKKGKIRAKIDYLFESAGPGCTYVMSRCLMEHFVETMSRNTNLISSESYHDWLVYAVARSSGFKWWIDPVPSMLYRQHGNNVLGANKSFSAFRRRLKMIRSGWYVREILRVSEICGQLEITPIKRLRRWRLRDRLVFVLLSWRYRRSPIAGLGLGIAVALFARGPAS
jgi:rhamnosyltransferase